MYVCSCINPIYGPFSDFVTEAFIFLKGSQYLCLECGRKFKDLVCVRSFENNEYFTVRRILQLKEILVWALYFSGKGPI